MYRRRFLKFSFFGPKWRLKGPILATLKDFWTDGRVMILANFWQDFQPPPLFINTPFLWIWKKYPPPPANWPPPKIRYRRVAKNIVVRRPSATQFLAFSVWFFWYAGFVGCRTFILGPRVRGGACNVFYFSFIKSFKFIRKIKRSEKMLTDGKRTTIFSCACWSL